MICSLGAAAMSRFVCSDGIYHILAMQLLPVVREAAAPAEAES
jgi:hypothetical protein